jgi:hypothetical protein
MCCLANVFSKWKLNGKDKAFVTDSGSNILAALSILNIPHIPCMAHVLHLTVSKGLEVISHLQVFIIISQLNYLDQMFSNCWALQS